MLPLWLTRDACSAVQCWCCSVSHLTHPVDWCHLTYTGTRDFAPDDYRLRQWLFGEFEAVSRLFGFEQFETPVLESEELFVRKAGEEITQQLYNFEVTAVPTRVHLIAQMMCLTGNLMSMSMGNTMQCLCGSQAGFHAPAIIWVC